MSPSLHVALPLALASVLPAQGTDPRPDPKQREQRLLQDVAQGSTRSRCIALRAAREHETPRLAQRIRELAQSESEAVVRRTAIETLGYYTDTEAGKVLWSCLEALRGENDDLRLRAATLEALGRRKDGKAFDLLVAALREQDTDLVRCAARGLGLLADARAYEPLVKTFDEHLRNAATGGVILQALLG